MKPHLRDSGATRVRSEGPDQSDGQEGEEQSPEDVHQVVDDVSKRPLQATQETESYKSHLKHPLVYLHPHSDLVVVWCHDREQPADGTKAPLKVFRVL